MTDREIIALLSGELSNTHRVPELDGLKEVWAITVEYHTRYENRYVFTRNVIAESIIDAINIVGDIMGRLMEKFDLSDYHILSATIIPELH